MFDARSARFAIAGLVLTAVSGCSRADEDVARERLERWFALGETVSFHSTQDCAAASFKLMDMNVKSTMSVVTSTPQALIVLSRRGAVALKNDSLSPDSALVEFSNADRSTGIMLRRAALEGRMCMNDATESAFRYALDNPRAALAYDAESGMLMLLDPRTGLLVLAVGAQQWAW